MLMTAPQVPSMWQTEMIDISEVISMAAPRARNMVNMNWLRSCYNIVYGTMNVFIQRNGNNVNIDRELSVASLETALQALGTPDLLTWGCWLNTCSYIEEHSGLTPAPVQHAMMSQPVWSESVVSAV
jgi:hypothetical protein